MVFYRKKIKRRYLAFFLLLVVLSLIIIISLVLFTNQTETNKRPPFLQATTRKKFAGKIVESKLIESKISTFRTKDEPTNPSDTNTQMKITSAIKSTLDVPPLIRAASINNAHIRFSLFGDFISPYLQMNSVYWFDMQKVADRQLKLIVTNLLPNVKDTSFSVYIICTDDHTQFQKITVPPMMESSYEVLVATTFDLDTTKKVDRNRIIHQSYKQHVNISNFKAMQSWMMMNPNYEYRYWTDEDAALFVKNNFDEQVQQAIDMLHAGAYKADILRLCFLLFFGGVWIDISAVCETPLDCVLTEIQSPVVSVADIYNGSKINGIYQAFIAVTTPRNEMIEFLLHYTANRVLHHEQYSTRINKIFDLDIRHTTLGVTGPFVFGFGVKEFLNIPMDLPFTEGTYFRNNSKTNQNQPDLHLFSFKKGRIFHKSTVVFFSKYPNYHLKRTNLHYSTLFHAGYVFMRKVSDRFFHEHNISIFQIWVQSRYVSDAMYTAISSWVENYQTANYFLVTEDSSRFAMRGDPNLLDCYNQLQPYRLKSELYRYFHGFHTGGIYSNTEFVCHRSIIKLIASGFDMILCFNIDEQMLTNSFFYTRKGHGFWKVVYETFLNNIDTKTGDMTDPQLTGNFFLTSLFCKYFSFKPPFHPGQFHLKGTSIKLLSYSKNLPLPEGDWKQNARNFFVQGNLLTTNLLSSSGRWIHNSLRFEPFHNLKNIDGRASYMKTTFSANNIKIQPSKHSSLIYCERYLYASTEYDEYDFEKKYIFTHNERTTSSSLLQLNRS